MNKKFILVDALALAYKAYFALIRRPLVTKKGEPSSAVFGFVNQLFKILETNRPDYIAVAFDSKEKTFRHEKFEAYKANREAMPDDLIPQIDRIKQIIEALNIPVYIMPRYEADDIIGSAAVKAEKEGLETIVITPDKDFNQIITDKIKIARSSKTSDEIIIWDKKYFTEQFGFKEPKQMIDYLALVGDASDNIPGVKGIGEKTAIPLIQKYGNVETLYEHLNEISSESVRNKLAVNKENAIISKDLATIDCKVDLEFNFEDAKFTPPDFEQIKEIFTELEFKTLYSKFLSIYLNKEEYKADKDIELTIQTELKTFNKDNAVYKLITTVKEAEGLAKKLSASDLFVFDTETDSLDVLSLNLAGVSFAMHPGEAYYIAINPFAAKENDLFSQPVTDRVPLEEFIRIMKPVLENKKIKKVCQNAKYDFAVMRTFGINVQNLHFDTMLASYVIDPDEKHGMDELAKKYLDYQPIPLSDLIGAKKDPSKIFDVPLNNISDYSCEDSDITFQLYKIFEDKLKKDGLEKIAYDIEFPLVNVLEDMEREGIKVDKAFLNQLSSDYQILLDNYTSAIYKCSGTEFNINSTKQLQEVLFGKLGLATVKKTKTGFSTDAKSLEQLRGTHEIIDLLFSYREIQKLKSTYTDALPKLIRKDTGRIHTSFSQTTAVTGRLSSIDPNLQNIPIRTEMGRELRKAFIPRDKDHIILSADYSQIELRIMAAICGDEALGAAFRNNEDIHTSTAALVFMVDKADVTPEMRRRAKEVNFGILYGIGPFGLKTRLGITQTHAKEIIDTYFNTFKKVKAFIDDSVEKAKIKGYAETLLGRRRYLLNINSNNRMVKQFEERVAVNMPIQGTAADMIKIAMINIHNELNRKKLKTKMVLQVHDELVFDVYKKELDEVKVLVKDLMENALKLSVPIAAEIGTGENWLDAH